MKIQGFTLPAKQEVMVLTVLADTHQPLPGAGILSATNNSIGRNSIYTVLMRMVARGLISVTEEGGRRTYSITPRGKVILDAYEAAEKAARGVILEACKKDPSLLESSGQW